MARLEARGDVWVTGGAYAGAPKSTLDRVKARILTSGLHQMESFWVEGKVYDSWNDSVERQRFGKRYPCQDTTLNAYK